MHDFPESNCAVDSYMPAKLTPFCRRRLEVEVEVAAIFSHSSLFWFRKLLPTSRCCSGKYHWSACHRTQFLFQSQRLIYRLIIITGKSRHPEFYWVKLHGQSVTLWSENYSCPLKRFISLTFIFSPALQSLPPSSIPNKLELGA